MPKLVDLTGQRFGRMTVIEKTGERDKAGNFLWKCKCECGSEVNVITTYLKRGKIKSCGCLREELLKNNLRGTHATSVLTQNSIDKPRVTNLSTGIKNISYKPEQGIACFVVNIIRDKRKYSQYFPTLKEAERAKEYVLSRYKKGISNWNAKL